GLAAVPPGGLSLLLGRARRGGVGTYHDRVGDLDDLVSGEIRPRGVLANRLRTGGLIDADRAHAPVGLAQHVAADPADVVGHLLVADFFGAPGRQLELARRAPRAAAQDHVRVHLGLTSLLDLW